MRWQIQLQLQIKITYKMIRYLIIALLACGIVAFFGVRGCMKERKENKSIAKISDIATYDSTSYYRDLYNTEHATAEVASGDLQAVRIIYARQIDSVCKMARIARKQLIAMENVTANISGQVITNVVRDTVHDTINGHGFKRIEQRFDYQDAYLQLKGLIDTEIHITYMMEVPISINTYWKRRWFLGKKHYRIDGYSTNNNVHLIGLTKIQIN